MFSFKRLFLCSSPDCQNIFLNFHLNFLACTTLNVRERGCGKALFENKVNDTGPTSSMTLHLKYRSIP